MRDFIFDKDIFKEKFLQGKELRNRAKSTAKNCDSVCPVGSDTSTQYSKITEVDILTDLLHSLQKERINTKKLSDINDKLMSEIEMQVKIDDRLKPVFRSIMEDLYLGDVKDSELSTLSLLIYRNGTQADIGKFLYDVLLNDETRVKLKKKLNEAENPLDDIVNRAYSELNVLQKEEDGQVYTRILEQELKGMFEILNRDIQATLNVHEGFAEELTFLISYYSFIYLTQIALRLERDLYHKESDESMYLLFKMGKESVSDDRECIALGWRRLEKKTKKIFSHLILLNMLNEHDNTSPFFTYSDLYELYEDNRDLRAEMEAAVEFLIDEYTVKHTYSARNGGTIKFAELTREFGNAGTIDYYMAKIQFLFDCIEYQLQVISTRETVRRNVWCNYERLLKMRFVKSWGNQGKMIMISNNDLLLMIRICQRSSENMIPNLGIQINDLFKEFEMRGLYFDGQSKQYIIKHLHEINLIDSKSDSEEAQYVKQIQ